MNKDLLYQELHTVSKDMDLRNAQDTSRVEVRCLVGCLALVAEPCGGTGRYGGSTAYRKWQPGMCGAPAYSMKQPGTQYVVYWHTNCTSRGSGMVVGKLGGRAGLTSRRVTLAGLVTLNICWTSTYFEAGRPGFIVCQHTCYYHSLACVGDEDFRCKSIWGKVEGVVDRHMYVATWSFSTFLMLLNKISSNWACISTYQCMVH